MMDGREVHELGDESAAYEMPGRGQNDLLSWRRDMELVRSVRYVRLGRMQCIGSAEE